VTTDLRAAIAAWQAAGGTTAWPPPQDVVALSLTQQKIYGTLSLHPRMYRRVLPLISADLRSQAEGNVSAGASLISLVAPSSAAVTFKTKAPLPADTLLRYYKQAQARFGVPWQLLAAVNFIESRFGRVISNSYAGAQGPMQFIQSTWAAYGLGGNVRVPRDAIMGAANYLHAFGSPGDDAGALFQYNPVHAYVRAVMFYTGQIRLDPAAFYEYYNWQVFVLTPSGLKQLTGPGS
jgi:soluble lytic murein transglycosylase-like protein